MREEWDWQGSSAGEGRAAQPNDLGSMLQSTWGRKEDTPKSCPLISTPVLRHAHILEKKYILK